MAKKKTRTGKKGENKISPDDKAAKSKTWDEDVEKKDAPAKKFADPTRSQLPEGTVCILNPKSQYMKKWDMIMVILLIYTATVTPYEVGFLRSSFNALFVINRIVDGLFAKDLVMQFMSPFWDHDEGTWVTDHGKIAARYVRGWFFIDLGSILPFDTLGLVMDSGSLSQLKVLRVIRLFRLAKLLRIFRSSRIFARWESQLGVSYSKMTMMKFMAVVFIIAHWGACVFRLIIDVEDYRDATDSPVNWLNQYSEHTLTPVEQYIVALYWSVMTVTTIGYGDVVAKTSGERVLSICSMVMGGSVYAYVIGSICGVISKMDPATAEFRTTMDELNLYMEENDIPFEMRVRLREYFQYCRQMQRNKHYHDLLLRMSPTLRGEVANYINSLWVENVPFFNPRSREEARTFVTEISLVLQPEAYAPKEMIVRVGEPTEKMYIMQRGVVARRGHIIGGGAYFGADMILHNAKRHYLVRALTYVDVYSLSKSSLEDVLRRNKLPETNYLIRQAALRLAFKREIVRYASIVQTIFDIPRHSNHPIVQKHRQSIRVNEQLTNTGAAPPPPEFLAAGLLEQGRVERRQAAAEAALAAQRSFSISFPPSPFRGAQPGSPMHSMAGAAAAGGGGEETPQHPHQHSNMMVPATEAAAGGAAAAPSASGRGGGGGGRGGRGGGGGDMVVEAEREIMMAQRASTSHGERKEGREEVDPATTTTTSQAFDGGSGGGVSTGNAKLAGRRYLSGGGGSGVRLPGSMQPATSSDGFAPGSIALSPTVRRGVSAVHSGGGGVVRKVVVSPGPRAPASGSSTASKVLSMLESRHSDLMSAVQNQSKDFRSRVGTLEAQLGELRQATEKARGQWRLGLALVFVMGAVAVVVFAVIATSIQTSLGNLAHKMDGAGAR